MSGKVSPSKIKFNIKPGGEARRRGGIPDMSGKRIKLIGISLWRGAEGLLLSADFLERQVWHCYDPIAAYTDDVRRATCNVSTATFVVAVIKLLNCCPATLRNPGNATYSILYDYNCTHDPYEMKRRAKPGAHKLNGALRTPTPKAN